MKNGLAAMIFAAGMGTRLMPLTENTPKALVWLGDKPLLLHTIEYLKRFGVNHFVINVHHFADQIVRFVSEIRDNEIEIILSDERDYLLETGGGFLNAVPFLSKFQGPWILMNVDIVTGLDLGKMLDFHKRSNALVTLAVQSRDTSRYFLTANNGRICGWENTKTGDKIVTNEGITLIRKAFSGIHIVNSILPDLITENGKFSITGVYLRLSNHYSIQVFDHSTDYWFDLGSIESLERARKFLNLP
jgi:N-acetyl-alpha-D-muramate 1-phosphate uridylyltransferase